jgi:HEAT repeat protein
MKITLKTDKETIIKILKNSDVNKKLKIFNMLDEFQEPDRVRILLRILEDGSWCLREKAARELAKVGSKVVPRLVKICGRSYWYSRSAACLTLGEIGDLGALGTIVGLLDDENPTVVKEALNAIIKMAKGDPGGLAVKFKAVVTSENKRNRTLRMIEKAAPAVHDDLKSRIG